MVKLSKLEASTLCFCFSTNQIMPDSQSLIKSLLASTTKVTSTLTENALDLLKYQQSQLQKQLLKQELLNANLYQSLLDSGILSGNN